MSLKKSLKRKGQVTIEYMLLATISIVGFLASNFILAQLYDKDMGGSGALNDHFEEAVMYITATPDLY